MENLVKYVFGWLDLRRVFSSFFFLHIQNNLKLQSFCVMLLVKKIIYVCECLECCKNPEGSEIRQAIFFCGNNFCPGIFCLVLLKALGIYLRFDFCPRLFDNPRHLKSCVLSWGLDSCIEDTNYKKRFECDLKSMF